MAKKYIELEAAIKAIEKPKVTPGGVIFDALKKACQEEVRNLPVADVVEMKHGQWMICSDGYYPYCSVCKTEPQGRVMTDYCPNCGAKMDGGQDK